MIEPAVFIARRPLVLGSAATADRRNACRSAMRAVQRAFAWVWCVIAEDLRGAEWPGPPAARVFCHHMNGGATAFIAGEWLVGPERDRGAIFQATVTRRPGSESRSGLPEKLTSRVAGSFGTASVGSRGRGRVASVPTRTEPETHASVVYFIQGGAVGPIKIGVTTNILARVRSLQTGSSSTLRVLRTMLGDARDEVDMHARFGKYRQSGEWFSPSRELMQFIDALPWSPMVGTNPTRSRGVR